MVAWTLCWYGCTWSGHPSWIRSPGRCVCLPCSARHCCPLTQWNECSSTVGPSLGPALQWVLFLGLLDDQEQGGGLTGLTMPSDCPSRLALCRVVVAKKPNWTTIYTLITIDWRQGVVFLLLRLRWEHRVCRHWHQHNAVFSGGRQILQGIWQTGVGLLGRNVHKGCFIYYHWLALVADHQCMVSHGQDMLGMLQMPVHFPHGWGWQAIHLVCNVHWMFLSFLHLSLCLMNPCPYFPVTGMTSHS